MNMELKYEFNKKIGTIFGVVFLYVFFIILDTRNMLYIDYLLRVIV